MRLSDAGLRHPQTKLIYTNHRLSPCLTEAAARDRSNRWLGAELTRMEHPLLSMKLGWILNYLAGAPGPKFCGRILRRQRSADKHFQALRLTSGNTKLLGNSVQHL